MLESFEIKILNAQPRITIGIKTRLYKDNHNFVLCFGANTLHEYECYFFVINILKLFSTELNTLPDNELITDKNLGVKFCLSRDFQNDVFSVIFRDEMFVV